MLALDRHEDIYCKIELLLSVPEACRGNATLAPVIHLSVVPLLASDEGEGRLRVSPHQRAESVALKMCWRRDGLE
eukprot:scaffold490184_cov15-Prasinocladus_malaysianus.AAC.1